MNPSKTTLGYDFSRFLTKKHRAAGEDKPWKYPRYHDLTFPAPSEITTAREATRWAHTAEHEADRERHDWSGAWSVALGAASLALGYVLGGGLKEENDSFVIFVITSASFIAPILLFGLARMVDMRARRLNIHDGYFDEHLALRARLYHMRAADLSIQEVERKGRPLDTPSDRPPRQRTRERREPWVNPCRHLWGLVKKTRQIPLKETGELGLWRKAH